MTEWRTLVNHRILIREQYRQDASLIECRVIEVSPGGKIKLKSGDSKFNGWHEPYRIGFIEDLGEENKTK